MGSGNTQKNPNEKELLDPLAFGTAALLNSVESPWDSTCREKYEAEDFVVAAQT